jgi:hypothetical protein
MRRLMMIMFVGLFLLAFRVESLPIQVNDDYQIGYVDLEFAPIDVVVTPEVVYLGEFTTVSNITTNSEVLSFSNYLLINGEELITYDLTGQRFNSERINSPDLSIQLEDVIDSNPGKLTNDLIFYK